MDIGEKKWREKDSMREWFLNETTLDLNLSEKEQKKKVIVSSYWRESVLIDFTWML